MSTHGVDIPGVTEAVVRDVKRHAGPLGRAMAAVNAVMVFVGMLLLLVAALVLTYSVFSRYLFKSATDWQDEVAVFCIVVALFLRCAWVQAQRRHIGIEAVASILPASINRVRTVVVDCMTL